MQKLCLPVPPKRVTPSPNVLIWRMRSQQPEWTEQSHGSGNEHRKFTRWRGFRGVRSNTEQDSFFVNPLF